MFGPSLAAGKPAVSAPGSTAANAADGRLKDLLAGIDEQDPGFAAQWHALLLNLTPPMLQRLEQMIASGKDLPQAVRQVLADATGLLARVGPFDPEGAGLGKEQLNALARNAKGMPDGQPPIPLLARAANLDVAMTTLTSPGIVNGPVGDVAARAPLPPQLTNSLLEMGIPQPVGSRTWPSALADRVVWMTQGDQQYARLTLNPPQLGPLEVRISVNQDQTSVTFVAAHAAVRDAIEAAMPKLRELFDQQSLALVHAEVADPGAGQEQRDPTAQTHSTLGTAEGDGLPDEETDGVSSSAASAVGHGLVDLFA